MQNTKYYNDIKDFPNQFERGFDLAKKIKIQKEFNKVVICGMGGSSFYTALINDYLADKNDINLRIDTVKAYDIPKNTDKKTLFFVVSYSGNTEESISCLNEIIEKGLSCIVVCSGGRLREIAEENKLPTLLIPTGIQPRLSTGYFIGGILQILTNIGLIPDLRENVINATKHLNKSLDEKQAIKIAKQIKGNVPLIYSTDNNSSLAYISKIKFNENSKTQAFWNYFPELNHNEMVGFTNIIMPLIFIIFKSQFTNIRNIKRIGIFTNIMEDKGATVFQIDLKGNSVLAEILYGYYFIDHVTYYLALEYGIDPEPVPLVEEFKSMLF